MKRRVSSLPSLQLHTQGTSNIHRDIWRPTIKLKRRPRLTQEKYKGEREENMKKGKGGIPRIIYVCEREVAL